MPPGLQPMVGGREVCLTTMARVLESLAFLLHTSVGLPHGFSQTSIGCYCQNVLVFAPPGLSCPESPCSRLVNLGPLEFEDPYLGDVCSSTTAFPLSCMVWGDSGLPGDQLCRCLFLHLLGGGQVYLLGFFGGDWVRYGEVGLLCDITWPS